MPINALSSSNFHTVSQADFNELERAAELSSAAYSGCVGSAFGVTITLQLSNADTDTQVDTFDSSDTFKF